MGSLGIAIGLLVAEALVIAGLRMSIKQKNHILMVITLIVTIVFFSAINLEEARLYIGINSRHSKYAAWSALFLVGTFLLLRIIFNKNLISNTLKEWNKTTHNLLSVSLLTLVAISLY